MAARLRGGTRCPIGLAQARSILERLNRLEFRKIDPHLRVGFAAVLPTLVARCFCHPLIELAPFETEIETGVAQGLAFAEPVVGERVLFQNRTGRPSGKRVCRDRLIQNIGEDETTCRA